MVHISALSLPTKWEQSAYLVKALPGWGQSVPDSVVGPHQVLNTIFHLKEIELKTNKHTKKQKLTLKLPFRNSPT